MIKDDMRRVEECCKYIEEVNSDNEYGHLRNWELYKINLYLEKSDKKFLSNAYERMQKDLEAIVSDSSKKLFLKNFTYGELITKEFKKEKK